MSDLRDAIFLREDQPIDAAGFNRAAIDPSASVVIDACAGSGKTTLLVRRIVRCLLAGAAPDSILAITFTRAAAQEMQERVQAMLRRLAFEADDTVLRILADELMLAEAAPAQLALARSLYERVLTDRRGIELTTFHRWFWQLARLGSPAGSADPVDELVENGEELISAARLRWLDGLRDPTRRPIAEAFDRLVAGLGAFETQRLMRAFVGQRVDWLASVAVAGEALPDPADEVALLSAAAVTHRRQWQQWCALARTQVPSWQGMTDADLMARTAADVAIDSGLVDRGRDWASLLAKGAKAAQEISTRLAVWIDTLVSGRGGEAPTTPEHVDSTGMPGAPESPAQEQGGDPLLTLRQIVLTVKGEPRSCRFDTKAFAPAVTAAGGLDAVAAAWGQFCADVITLSDLMTDARSALPRNGDLLICSASFTAACQVLKRERGALDFVDLEAVAGRMLRDDAWAALLQVRLDRRYRHLMFDEFQDTSSLQWTVIQQWLTAYAGAGAGEAPSVFVVGDPKQAIYRFRGAESRVFAAATELLRETFGAIRLTTATTRRNAPAVMAALNEAFGERMPGFRRQATLAADGPALVWRLPRPMVDVQPAAKGDAQAAAMVDDTDQGVQGPSGQAMAVEEGTAGRDWLTDLRDAAVEHHREEGLAIGRAILAARSQFQGEGHPLPWREVIVLARSRSGFSGYERALRSLGIPVVSDRRGGLLESLEAGDLIALLQFAHAADDDLALARVLRSPLIGFEAARIGRLAGGRASGTRLLERLRADDDPVSQAALARIESWVDAARRLPIHDLFDRVIADADAEMAYAACVDPANREIAVGNLRALVGLALDHDGGRYPGIDRFLDHVGVLERLDDRDAPNEGRPTEHDAVRLMTVHGSKGLEADLVVLADTGRSEPVERARLAIDWPPVLPAPQAIWFRLGNPHLGLIGRRIDADDAPLDVVEDWNLLYVATTRARRGLVISARRAGGRASSGLSWYERLAAVPAPGPDVLQDSRDDRSQDVAQDAVAVRSGTVTAPADRAVANFPSQPGFRGLALPPISCGERQPAAAAAVDDDTMALAAGTGLHAVLEWRGRGVDEAGVAAALAALGLPAALAARATVLADRVRSLPALAGAFEGHGRDEFELFDAAGHLLRIDRIVRVGDALWIIDYKWAIEASLRPSYIAQLEAYREAVQQLPALPEWALAGGGPTRIQTVLVDATGGRADFDPR